MTKNNPSNLREFSNLHGKRVLVTGHTGFTGGWLVLALRLAGAEVIGFSLPPITKPSLFEAANIADGIDSHFGDITSPEQLSAVFGTTSPDLVIHLAAQPRVRLRYEKPSETFLVNTQGTANILEACRVTPSVSAVVCVTTDKVYENNEWDWPYRETDLLGGKDPYSASKAAAEHVIRGYQAAFGIDSPRGLAIGVARGGNIIGGGDWSSDRLIPDYVQSAVTGQSLVLRNPNSTRPWQHVIALVDGYLHLLNSLAGSQPKKFARAWNFGPIESQSPTVHEVALQITALWKELSIEYVPSALSEAGKLLVDSSNARKILDWTPVWDTVTSLNRTIEWYREFYENGVDARDLCLAQLHDWFSCKPSNSQGGETK